MIMRLTTPVHIQAVPTIDYNDKILLLGSCFADNVGEKLQQHYFQTTLNPLGTLYNPASIAEAIRLAGTKDTEVLPLIEWGGLWHSMSHHGTYSNPDKEIALQQCMASIANLRQSLRESSVIVVTFGTAWIYEYAPQFPNANEFSVKVAANCHKMPANWFVRRRLSVEEIVDMWYPIVASMPEKHWIFTISPIRHIKDGLHENQLSKAILLQAVDCLTEKCSNSLTGGPTSHFVHSGLISYFPAYEIMIDELRDYRFYADDLVHPSPMAIEYIWQRFVDSFITSSTKEEMIPLHQLWKDRNHTFLHPESEEAIAFQQRTQKRLEELQTKYSWLR